MNKRAERGEQQVKNITKTQIKNKKTALYCVKHIYN